MRTTGDRKTSRAVSCAVGAAMQQAQRGQARGREDTWQGGVDEGRRLCLAQGPGNLRRDLRWYAKYETDAYRRTVQNGDAESGLSRMLP